jgi:hypothetical protein
MQKQDRFTQILAMVAVLRPAMCRALENERVTKEMMRMN